MTDNSLDLKAAYFTLGCKLNFSETSTIGVMLRDRGVERAAQGDTPDLIVINTCSVTEMADKKGRQLIRRLAHRYPEATMIVTGCYAQLKPGEVAAIDGVDIVLGSKEKLRIAQYLDNWLETRKPRMEVTPPFEIKEFMSSCERGDRTRYFLKVQDGCDYFCSYCTIPYARGRSRSGKIADLVEQARKVAAEGGKEIVITGVNIGEFGSDTGESFLDLLKAFDAVKGIERYRISSIEPNLLTEEIINWVAKESRAVMPHFHIPLQAGSDAVLKLMHRRYDTALFADRISLIKKLMPDAFIGVDVIAGARGETDEEWKRSLEFINSLGVTRLHVFPYSERPGTKALNIDYIVPMSERHRRVAELTHLSDEHLRKFMASHRGKKTSVLWEQPHGNSNRMHGFTDNYIRVEAPYRQEYVNTVTEVILGDILADQPDTMSCEFADQD